MIDARLSIVHNLVEHFLERQRIIIEAMCDLRPDLITSIGIDKLLNLDVSDNLDNFRSRRKKGEISQRGIWNTQWEYYLHGHGVRLENIFTGEPLDWDVGHPRSFDRYRFLVHLDWRTKAFPNNSQITEYYEAFSAFTANKQTELQVMDEYLNYLVQQEYFDRDDFSGQLILPGS